MCACMHAHMHAHTCPHMHTHVHMHMHAHACTCMHNPTHPHTHIHTHMHTHTHTQAYTCMHARSTSEIHLLILEESWDNDAQEKINDKVQGISSLCVCVHMCSLCIWEGGGGGVTVYFVLSLFF